MNNTLSVKLALLFAGAFIVVVLVLVIATQTMFDRERLTEMSVYVMLASAAFGLLAALCVVRLVTRRVQRLTDVVETMAQGGFTRALRVPDADPNGDEIGRLATHVERMSERLAEQLAELERAKGRRLELLANVSHDLRTPLASMQGYLELLLMRHGNLAPAEERNYLETAVRQSERLGRLVGDLFELTRLEAQEAPPQPETFSLSELAQDVVQKFALDARQRRVDLRAAESADDGGEGGESGEGGEGGALWVHADIGMVERVLENLLDNALRHTPAGGAVTIELGRSAPRAHVRVRDTGAGIPSQELAGIFERYERADRSVPGGHGGLGLAIARQLVNLHGGELSVQSALGRGTCFTFDLPLAEAPSAAALPMADTTQRMSRC
jgi:signal transduction histidine kinase